MDTKHTTAIRRICCMIIFYFISNHNYLTDATPVSLEFCMSTYHTSDSTSETGAIKSPGFQRTVADPGNVPSKCTIYITVCSGCRIILTNTNMINCNKTDACFLQRASVTLKGFPLKTILFNSSVASVLNVVSLDRSVELVFNKSPNDPATGEFGFNLFYKVREPAWILYTENSTVQSGTFSSPGFPDRYESNGDVFYFRFQPTSRRRFLTLNFSDWYLSKYSKVTIIQGTKSSTYNRLSDRPSVISSKDLVLITFETGIGDTTTNYIGFKATYEYSYSSSLGEDATRFRNEVYDSTFGGAINYEQYGPGGVDYIWVIPKSELIGSDNASLKLRIDSKSVYMIHNDLEIRSGPTSEDRVVYWHEKNSHYSERGFYLRLRKRALPGDTIAFSAVYAWTGAVQSSTGAKPCAPTDFVCYDPLECLKSKDLQCDGINHCEGGIYATDESDCKKISKPCSSYWSCRTSMQNPICITRRCDGKRDCLDSSDEIGCTYSTVNPYKTTTTNWYPYHDDYYANDMTLSIALPFVIIGIIIIIIIIGYVTNRRRRQLSVNRQTLQNIQPAGPLDRNIDDNSAHFTPTSDEVISPPSYGDIVFHNNQGFVASPDDLAPPPYEEIAKSLGPVESSAPPPPYLLADEMGNIRENRTSRHRSGEQRTSPRHPSGQRTSGSRDALISDNGQC